MRVLLSVPGVVVIVAPVASKVGHAPRGPGRRGPRARLHRGPRVLLVALAVVLRVVGALLRRLGVRGHCGWLGLLVLLRLEFEDRTN